MKRILTLLMALMMTTTALATNVAADDHDGPGDGGDGGAPCEDEACYHEMFNNTDADSDGNVSFSELESAFCPPDGCEQAEADNLTMMFNMADTDGSEGISWDEFWDYFNNEGDNEILYLLTMFDADDSGDLSTQEMIDGLNYFREQDGQPSMSENEENYFTSLFDDADSNSDGLLDLDEFTSFWEDVQQSSGPSLEEVMAMFDADGSGNLTYQEIIDGINANNQADGEPPLSEEEKMGLQQAFHDSDLNSDGYLDMDEFEDFWDAIGYGGADDDPSPGTMLAMCDANGDEQLTAQEIIDCFNAGNSEEGEPPMSSEEEALVNSFFNASDADGDGFLNLQEFEDFWDTITGDDWEDGCPFEDDDFCEDVDEICDSHGPLYDPSSCGTESAHFCADGAENGTQDPGCTDIVDLCYDGVWPQDLCDAFMNFDHDSEHDSDGDGVLNEADQCEGYDDSIDVDGDGVPDGCDALIDSDGDGVTNVDDQCEGYDDSIDVDGDGVPDGCDALIDSDGDAVSDDEDAFPDDVCAVADNDGDGDPDYVLDGENDPVPDCQTDLVEDDDDDNDGVDDADDAFPLDPNEDTDTDGDGIGNNADNDDDNDGTLDDDDDFPLDSTQDTEDTDTDGDDTSGTDDNSGSDDNSESGDNEEDDDDDEDGGGLPGFTLGLTITAMMGALMVAGRRRQE